MKTQITKRNHELGTALLVTLVAATIVGTTLASYLVMVSAQHRSTVRSATWNTSMAMSEAGIEDALQLLNSYTETFDSLTNWIAIAPTNNWALISSNVYYNRRYVGSNYYDAYITNFSWGANVSSSGHAMWNYNIARAPSPIMLAAAGTQIQTGAGPMTRRVIVQTKIDALFSVAMAALQRIDFNGKNVATDSFDSGDPNYSTNGLYPYGIPSMTKANGSVVTDDTITNSLAVGNASIRGMVKTGPNGSVTIGPNGSVGDSAWVNGGTTGIETGHFRDDMNVIFPDVVMPSGTWLNATKTSGNGPSSRYNGTQYDYIITSSGDYQITQNITGGIAIASNVNARIKITGTVSISGNAQILIDNGATLKIYMQGPTFSITGNGIINNNGNANNFYYFGLPSNTSVTFGGNATFTGAIYAPEAAFTLGGGGNNAIDFIGASVTKSVLMNGHFNFHYDENLARNNMGRGYIPVNWKEGS